MSYGRNFFLRSNPKQRSPGANRHTKEFCHGRNATLSRLKRLSGLEIEEDGDICYLSIDGHKAPVVIMHGFVSIRIMYGTINRVTFSVGKCMKSDDIDAISWGIKRSHEWYANSVITTVHES